MNETEFKSLISGQERGLVPALCRAGLQLLSWGYLAGVSLRNKLFDWEWKTIHRTGVPVVSVGNLKTGGTGKTPMVVFLANWFQIQKMRPAILSRGYRSAGDGANDEKLVLDQLCPGIPHLQNPDRASTVQKALVVLTARRPLRLHNFGS